MKRGSTLIQTLNDLKKIEAGHSNSYNISNKNHCQAAKEEEQRISVDLYVDPNCLSDTATLGVLVVYYYQKVLVLKSCGIFFSVVTTTAPVTIHSNSEYNTRLSVIALYSH